MLPITLRVAIGATIRNSSDQKQYKALPKLFDVSPAALEKLLEAIPVDYIIHGHTHNPIIEKNRIVLGAWHDTPSILSLSSKHIKLINSLKDLL